MSRRARVIVSAYNQLPYLKRTLRGWLRQTSRDFALTIADDGSTPDTTEWLSAFRKEAEAAGVPLDHVWQEDIGFRKSRILNEAILRSDGEPLLLFSDGDCIPKADFVERHLAVHESWSFQVGGAVRLTRETSEAVTESDVDDGSFERLVGPADRRDLAARHRKSRWGVWLRRKNRPKVLGLNLGVDRPLLEAINGFDENLVGWGGEDSDLRDRAMRVRPRPRVKSLYLATWVFHLWHPVKPGDREKIRRGAEERPLRCRQGLAEHTA
jgi:GT2 family glycosyltransferase